MSINDNDMKDSKAIYWLLSRFICIAISMSLVGAVAQARTADLQKLSGARLIENPSNDGDSFLVEAKGRQYHIRLYYVDCPETSAGSRADAQRVREQMRYFGLANAEEVIKSGNDAKKYVEQVLSKPFVVHTAFANAMGRSSQGRVYGFVTTAGGEDLGSLLVKNGLARTEGVGRKTPEGMPRAEMIDKLHDLEGSAMLKWMGIWAKSNADKMTELRDEQRSEDHKLKEVQEQVKEAGAPHTLLDVNKASKEELTAINGIGPVLAERIIAGRPYKDTNDLLRVKGIGKAKLEKIRPYFKH